MKQNIVRILAVGLILGVLFGSAIPAVSAAPIIFYGPVGNGLCWAGGYDPSVGACYYYGIVRCPNVQTP